MRQAALAIFVALGLYAAAEEGPLLTPRIRMPGERDVPQEIVIPDKLQEGWNMTNDDRGKLKEFLEKTNADRKGLLKSLEEANKTLTEARKKYNEVLAEIEGQQLKVQEKIGSIVGAEKAKEFAIRADLQPIIDWLHLTDEQVTKILDKEKALLADDPRSKIVEAAHASRDVAAAGTPATPEERAKQIELLKSFMEFNKKWLDTIKTELTPEQTKLWDERYRRTQYLIEPSKP